MKYYLMIALFGISVASQAQNGNAWANASIGEILVHDSGANDYSGRVHIKMTTEMNWIPDCIGGSSYYKKSFAIDLSRPAGQYQYSMLLAAKLADKNVTVQLNQNCIAGIAVVRNVSVSD